MTGYAIAAVQERASLFVAPGEEVYEGMVVGENPRPEDMDVNICREKKQTNIRAAASDDTVRLTTPRILSLEQSLEFIADDECVEVTPKTNPPPQGDPRRRRAGPSPQAPPTKPERGLAGDPAAGDSQWVARPPVILGGWPGRR